MNKHLTIRILKISLLCLLLRTTAQAQVDETKTSSDTLYIYDEEVIYDTLYLQSGQTNELLTKEEMLEAFQKSGTGQLYYKKGHYWLTGNYEDYPLDKSDLQMLFSAAQYETYLKAKRNQYISIPLFVVGGGAAGLAGTGLVLFCKGFVDMARAGSQYNDDLVVNYWTGAMRGLFMFGGGMLLTSACLIPAIVLSARSKVQLNGIVEEFNAPSTAWRLSFGPSPTGLGLTLSF